MIHPHYPRYSLGIKLEILNNDGFQPGFYRNIWKGKPYSLPEFDGDIKDSFFMSMNFKKGEIG
jgi:hypothetical protein